MGLFDRNEMEDELEYLEIEREERGWMPGRYVSFLRLAVRMCLHFHGAGARV